MSKPSFTMEELKKLHAAGELDRAKKGYESILKSVPDNAEALHMLGMAEAFEGNLTQATLHLRRATLNGEDPAIWLHLANVLKMAKKYTESEVVFQELLTRFANYPAAYNNFGTLYAEQQRWADAIPFYEKAVALQPDYVDAYYNLGLAFIRINKLAAACKAYQTILSINEDHPFARFQLAIIHMLREDFSSALGILVPLSIDFPDHLETLSNLATCYFKLGRWHEAYDFYLKALKLAPQDLQILFNLGVICMKQGKLKQAIQFYQESVNVNPEFFAGHYNLATAFLSNKQVDLAIDHYNLALKLDPENVPIKHTLSILNNDKEVVSTPKEYTRALFDSYADHYESHMLDALHYKVPKLLFEFLMLEKPISNKLTVLDLGCGTGLMAELIKPHAKKIIGVDVSPNMLAIAKQKHLYESLVEEDILFFLRDNTSKYALIMASDLFVYFGDIKFLIAAINERLMPGGTLLFNTEKSETDDYYMSASGRFAHKKEYVREIADSVGLNFVASESATLRMQNGKEVIGDLFIFEKPDE